MIKKAEGNTAPSWPKTSSYMSKRIACLAPGDEEGACE